MNFRPVIISLLALALFSTDLFAQSRSKYLDSLNRSYSNEYLDTVVVFKQTSINDYTMIGVNYGYTMSRMSLTPKASQDPFWTPGYFSVMLTHYSKMFDYLPYFGYTVGVAYGTEGFRLKQSKASGYTPLYDGQEFLKMPVVEVPFMAQVHLDAPPFKLMINAGIYGGYRLDVERGYDTVDPELQHVFKDYEIRWDYGLQGGGGIAIMINPIELHFNALLRYSWSSFYEPDYASEYYYRFAYPFDLMITAGIHFQLTKRTGMTSGALKKKAKQIVYGE